MDFPTDIRSLIDKKIDDLKTGQVAIFCGAGISFNSGIPTISHFNSELLKSIGANQEEKEKIVNSGMPFESLMAILLNSCKNLELLLNIFNKGEFNHFHIMLAKLASAGYVKTIYTTNFDKHIENALESEGLELGKNFILYSKDEDFDNIDWNDGKIKIIKLHGSIDNLDDMVITINKVAQKNLSLKRRRLIQNLFSDKYHDSVWVFGYSCSDVFDITPSILSLDNTNKNVFFIEHSNQKKIDQISINETKNPFRNFNHGERLYYNTDEIIEFIWVKLFSQKFTFKKYNTDWEKSIMNWSKINFKRSDFYIYRILMAITDYDKAYIRAKKHLIENNEGYVYSDLGYIAHSLGLKEKALNYLKKSLNLDSSSEGKFRVYTNLGTIYQDNGEYSKALYNYKNASKYVNTKYKKVNNHLHIGLCKSFLETDQKEKIRIFKEVIELAESEGMILESAQAKLGLSIIFLENNEKQKGIELFEDANLIASNLGSIQLKLDCFTRKAWYYTSIKKDYSKAIGVYNEMIKLSNNGNQFYHLAQAYRNLARCYLYLKDYNCAKNYTYKSISCYENHGIDIPNIEKERFSEVLEDIGYWYENQLEFDKALKSYNDALNLLEKKNHDRICNLYMKLGFMYGKKLNKFYDAKHYYELAQKFDPMTDTERSKMIQANLKMANYSIWQENSLGKKSKY